MARKVFLVAALLNAATSVQAQNSAGAAGRQPLSRAAFIAAMDAEYRQIDLNKDGVATPAELSANQQRIVAAAARQRAGAAFARLDSDRNGQLSPAEFERAFAAAKATDVTPVLKRLDSNGDSKVTIVEYRTLTLANFDRLDSDKDGVVTPAESRGATPRR